MSYEMANFRPILYQLMGLTAIILLYAEVHGVSEIMVRVASQDIFCTQLCRAILLRLKAAELDILDHISITYGDYYM